MEVEQKERGKRWENKRKLEKQTGKSTVQVIASERGKRHGRRDVPTTWHVDTSWDCAEKCPGGGGIHTVSNTLNESKPKPRQIVSPSEQWLPQSLKRGEKRKSSPAKDQNLTELGVFQSWQQKLEENGAILSMSANKGITFSWSMTMLSISPCIYWPFLSSIMQGIFKSFVHF